MISARHVARGLLLGGAGLAGAIALAAGPTSQNVDTGEVTVVKTLQPFKVVGYFEDNCSRCHGPYGSFYGPGFGKGKSDAQLRDVLKRMCEGPGNAPLQAGDLEVLLAYHRTMGPGQPYVTVNSVEAGTKLQGEIAPAADVQVRWEGGSATATVDGVTWTASVPAKAKDVIVVATAGGKTTRIDVTPLLAGQTAAPAGSTSDPAPPASSATQPAH